ncbi:response regulator transcription factor [Flavobacterium sp. 20NA77.7]|uniref:Response regulator transcription factor n=1 Tax=Flavobacterium nakdongensis TaxID=3073563 RepID=A0ABY9RAL1_9FLAO|nr:response regulator transcription factor [Flavobacterium sp. 20NA77.7]WMW78277.1 response regulator transcription factor [Flavobacterium sp. 20NA77.7]
MIKDSEYSFLVADDHSIIRNGLCLLINDTFSKAKVTQTESFDDILRVVKDVKLDLLILDINFPEGNSLSLIPTLKKLQPSMKILIFTSYDEEVYALRFYSAGVDGYLSKLSSPDQIEHALLTILKEGRYASDTIKNKILNNYLFNKSANPLDALSDREMEIAKLMVQGLGNLEISNVLNLKSTTVSTYKSRIFEKLSIDNLSALINVFNIHNILN